MTTKDFVLNGSKCPQILPSSNYFMNTIVI